MFLSRNEVDICFKDEVDKNFPYDENKQSNRVKIVSIQKKNASQ